MEPAKIIPTKSSSNTFSWPTGISAGMKRSQTLFSMELQACVFTEKGIEIRVTKVTNVLSFSCLCLTCGKGFEEQSSIMSHMKTHLQERDDDRSASTVSSSGKIEAAKIEAVPSPSDYGDGDPVCPGSEAGKCNLQEWYHAMPVVEDDKRSVDHREVVSTSTGVADSDDSEKGTSVSSKEEISKPRNTSGSSDPTSKISHGNVPKRNEILQIRKPYAYSAEKGPLFLEPNSSAQKDHRFKKKQKIPKRKKKPLVCNICGKIQVGKQEYSEHMNMHTGEQPYICSVCGLKYRRKADLKEHSKKHRQICLLTCPECGKQFTKPSALKDHSSIHTGEKPYSCTICGKHFRLQMHVNEHMVTHTGEKPHLCNLCGKRFSRSSHLKRHQLVHTGEKPHQCTICEKRFAQLFNLKAHAAKHESVRFDDNPPDSDMNWNVGNLVEKLTESSDI